MIRSNRIIANTVASYARLAVSALAGFITVPIVLRTLGSSDYGIFSVIAGCLGFLLFINGALTTGAQRHIAYSLGEGNGDEVRQWFAASIIVHLILGAAVLLLSAWATNWVVLKLLCLPPARVAAAKWIYRFIISALTSNILSTPYQAFLVAQESIVSLSAMTICGSVFQCVGVLCLRFIRGDALVWYSGIYVFSQLIMLLGPIVFCSVNYPECRGFRRSQVQMNRVKELLSFSGWSLVGNLAGQVRNQGPAVLLNRFEGTLASAAYGVATQINAFATNISGGMLRATSPAIVKCEASGNRSAMLQLSNLSNKYAFFLLWVAIGPVLCDLTYCLRAWLHQIPPTTEALAMLLLTALLIDQLTGGFMASIQAGGRIGLYQCIVSLPALAILPAGYFILRIGFPAAAVLWAGVVGAMISGAARIWFVRRMIGLRASDWLRDVLVPGVVVFLGCMFSMKTVIHFSSPGPVRLLSLYLVNTLTMLILGSVFASVRERRVFGQYLQRLNDFCRCKFAVPLQSK